MNDTYDTTRAIQTGLGPLRVRTLGSGPPVVLWHSLFVDSSTWDGVLEPLRQHRRLLLIDGPSHGGSAPAAHPFTLDDCAAAAAEVLDQVGIDEPVDWVGNAWGGHVGIAFAASRSASCRTLTTIGTPVRALNPAERRRSVALLALYRCVGPVRPLVNILCDALLGSNAEPSSRQIVGDAFRSADRRGMTVAMRSISLHRPDLTTALTGITIPTLFVTGTDDGMWPPSEAKAAVLALRHGGCVIVPGAGHIAPILHDPMLLVRLLIEFWRDPLHTAQAAAARA